MSGMSGVRVRAAQDSVDRTIRQSIEDLGTDVEADAAAHRIPALPPVERGVAARWRREEVPLPAPGIAADAARDPVVTPRATPVSRPAATIPSTRSIPSGASPLGERAASAPQTCEQLFTQHYQHLVNRARRIGGARLAAHTEDFVAQAFTNVLRSWGRVAGLGGAQQLAYLKAAVDNLICSERRRLRLAPHRALSLDAALARGPQWLVNQRPHPPAGNVLDATVDLEEVVAEREEVGELYRRALSFIDRHPNGQTRQRLTIALRLGLVGYRTGEIARTLCMRGGAVQTMFWRLERSAQAGAWQHATQRACAAPSPTPPHAPSQLDAEQQPLAPSRSSAQSAL